MVIFIVTIKKKKKKISENLAIFSFDFSSIYRVSREKFGLERIQFSNYHGHNCWIWLLQCSVSPPSHHD
jgi:hypothetical protein